MIPHMYSKMNQIRLLENLSTVLALKDLIFDVFAFLSRKDLDMLQVVNRRFNDVIVGRTSG